MEKRHEWKAAHGFRKFYKTQAEQVMKPINVEITMGYNIGVSASYYRPTEREVLEDYLKAIPPLTVNSNELLLQDQLKELTEKTKNDEYLIKGKLVEKDETIQSMREKYDSEIAILKHAIFDMQELLKIPETLFELAKSTTRIISSKSHRGYS